MILRLESTGGWRRVTNVDDQVDRGGWSVTITMTIRNIVLRQEFRLTAKASVDVRKPCCVLWLK